MPAPKDHINTPLKRGVRYSRKANMWLYFETFNQVNVADKNEWFNSETEAQARYESHK